MNWEHLFEQWLLPVLRVSSPLIFAALGGMWCERSGVIQIGLEGFMLVGSFFGAVSTLYFSNPYLGFFIAGLAGVALSLLYGVFKRFGTIRRGLLHRFRLSRNFK